MAEVPAPPRAPDNHEITVDLPCGGCGYNLRGLELGGRCPECGARIFADVLKGPFGGGDRRWLKRVSTGALILAIQAALTFLPLFLMIPTLTNLVDEFLGDVIGLSGAALLVLAAPIAALIGIAKFTAAPQMAGADPGANRARRRARLGSVPMVIGLPILTVYISTDTRFAVDALRFAFAEVAMFLLAVAAVSHAFRAHVEYASILAHRLDDREIPAKAKRAARLAGIAAPVIFAAAAYPWLVAIRPYFSPGTHADRPGDSTLTHVLLIGSIIAAAVALFASLVYSVQIHSGLRSVITERLESSESAGQRTAAEEPG